MELVKGTLGVSEGVLTSLREWVVSGIAEGDVILWSDDVKVLSVDGTEYWMELIVRSHYRENESGLYDVFFEMVVWDEDGNTVRVYDVNGNIVQAYTYVSFSSEFGVTAVVSEMTFRLEVVNN